MDTGVHGLVGSLARLSKRSVNLLSKHFLSKEDAQSQINTLVSGVSVGNSDINTVIDQQLLDGGTINVAIPKAYDVATYDPAATPQPYLTFNDLQNSGGGGGGGTLFSSITDGTEYTQNQIGNIAVNTSVSTLRTTYNNDLERLVAAMLKIGPTPAYTLSAGLPRVAFTITPSEGIQMGAYRTVSYTVNVSLGSWSGGTAYSSAERTGTITDAYNSVDLPQLYVNATNSAVAFVSNQATLSSFALESIPLQIEDVSFTGLTAYNNYGTAYPATDMSITPTFSPSTIRTYGIVTHTYPSGLNNNTGTQTETGHGEQETQRVYAGTSYIIVYGHNHDASPNESNRSVVRSPRPAHSLTVWDGTLTHSWITPDLNVQNTPVTDEFGVQYYDIRYTATNGRNPVDVKIELQQFLNPSAA